MANYYEERIALLDKKNFHVNVFGDGRNVKISNAEFWARLKVGDKIYPTVWFLRNIRELSTVENAAKEGLTIVEKGSITDSEGKWMLGEWHSETFNALFFEEVCLPMSFKYHIANQIWKINNDIL